MGERLSGNGIPGRRHPHPENASSGRLGVGDDEALEAVLAAVLSEGALDPDAEQQAVTAFRTARDAGVIRARTRRRDDWRLPARRRVGRPAKTTFGVVFASLALGGGAVAAVGAAASSAHHGGAGHGTAHPSATTSQRLGDGTSSESPGGLRAAKHPATAKDTEARCRAYEHVEDRGRTLDATVWQRLVAAAGGKDEIAAYCADQLARATPGHPSATGKTGPAGADTGKATAGTAAAGNDHGGAGNAAGSSGGSSGDTGSGKRR
jgi:hypothetical protein